MSHFIERMTASAMSPHVLDMALAIAWHCCSDAAHLERFRAALTSKPSNVLTFAGILTPEGTNDISIPNCSVVHSIAELDAALSRETKGQVQSAGLEEPVAMTHVVCIVIALCFRGLWKYPFDLSQNATKPFRGNDGEKSMVFMHITRDFEYLEDYRAMNDAVCAVAVFPYECGARFIVVLPRDGTQPLPAVDWETLCRTTMPTHELIVTIPQFSMRRQVDMMPYLAKLKASGLIYDRLLPRGTLASAYQDITMVFNNKGTWFMSIMVEKVLERSEKLEGPRVFCCDRPFRWAVVSAENHIIATGRLQ
jgi:hypothetical protein